MLVPEMINVQINVEETQLVIAFSGRVQEMVLRWQEAGAFSQAIKEEAEKIPMKGLAIPSKIRAELAKVTVKKITNKGHLVFLLNRADRLVLSYHAAVCMSDALYVTVQELAAAELTKTK